MKKTYKNPRPLLRPLPTPPVERKTTDAWVIGASIALVVIMIVALCYDRRPKLVRVTPIPLRADAPVPAPTPKKRHHHHFPNHLTCRGGAPVGRDACGGPR